MIKNIIIGILAVAVIVFGVMAYSSGNLGATGTTHWQMESFLQGLYAGTTRQLSISNAGLLTTSGGFTNSGTLTQSGALNVSGAFTASNDSRIAELVITGASSTLSGTTTTVITAAQACDNSFVAFSPSITEASTLNLPTTQALFADCLTTNGDEVRLYGQNKTASTTVVTVGNASTTLVYQGSTGGSATLAASSWVELTFIRVTDILMVVVMDQFKP